jgi:hypothetical protein
MGTIVVLLGYSVFKSRWRNAQEAKNEDFGTEMADVKKTLLPRNEFSGGIHPTSCPEADESNAKLLADTQYKGNNAKNEETHKVEAGIDYYVVQNQKDLEGYDDSHPKLETDFDRIDTQSESNAPDNTLKSHSQEKSNSFPEVAIPNKVEAADVQCPLHPMKPQKAPDNTLETHSQDSTNHFPEVVITKEVETVNVQTAHDSSHQNGHNNENVVYEVVAETPTSVPLQNNYVTANSDGLVMIPDGTQVYTAPMPVTLVRATIANRPPCGSYTFQYTY